MSATIPNPTPNSTPDSVPDLGPTPTSSPSPSATPRAAKIAAVVLAQLALVGVAVWAPLSARLTGEEILLRVEPVDPIDPFRGAYVDLGYPDLPAQPFGLGGDAGDASVDDEAASAGTVYVPLTKSGEVWVGGEMLLQAPDDGLFLKCDASDWRLKCGIESWFLPQDEALSVGELLRAGNAVATVKVDSSGHAALIKVEGAG